MLLKAAADAHHRAIGSIDDKGATSAADSEAINAALGRLAASVPESRKLSRVPRLPVDAGFAALDASALGGACPSLRRPLWPRMSSTLGSSSCASVPCRRQMWRLYFASRVCTL